MPPPRGSQPVRPRPPRKSGKQKISGAEIVAQARTWIGVPYLFGGTTRKGVDCSGLVQNVAEEVGIQGCPRTSEQQWIWSEHIHEKDAGAGDLVFFVGSEIDPPPGHVGILVAPGVMIDAPHTGSVVQQASFSNGPGTSRVIGYGRMRGAARSGSSNPFTGSGQGTATTASAGSAFAASAGSIIIMICVIILLALAFVALLGAGLLFKGRS